MRKTILSLIITIVFTVTCLNTVSSIYAEGNITVNTMTEGDTTITGTGTPKEMVYIYFPDKPGAVISGVESTTFVDENGNWEHASWFEMLNLEAGDTITFILKHYITSSDYEVIVEEGKDYVILKHEIEDFEWSIEEIAMNYTDTFGIGRTETFEYNDVLLAGQELIIPLEEPVQEVRDFYVIGNNSYEIERIESTIVGKENDKQEETDVIEDNNAENTNEEAIVPTPTTDNNDKTNTNIKSSATVNTADNTILSTYTWLLGASLVGILAGVKKRYSN